MKAMLIVGLMVLLTTGLRPALAAPTQEPELPTPSRGMLTGGGIAARPLVRYLAASLRLSQAQAITVQRAMRQHGRRTRTPEQLALYLLPVLTVNQFNQFLQLQDDADTYKNLQYLALR